MRGSPIMRALAAFVVLLVLGLPLWHLTHAAGDAPVLRSAPAAALKAVGLQLRFTTAPGSLRVLHLGKEVWSATAPGLEAGAVLQIPYPEAGVDLQFDVAWPVDGPLAAMRVRLTDPEGVDHEKSLWGKGAVSDVLSFP